ncbi:single-stranded DNA-binding protein [Corynebacterium mendelii]|uniref:Single-stranded DNA-binding protein n=1 Tax=Corynebacterium mendelii TaxID=2765362 RepID=A0A939ITS0_9CORY|nr:single-stranded DNA-binding protein [Corynebacterium mendelii]MBN9644149.1 single-stranded DNA-binding protein [Corynebacterium mendelii]
MRTPPVTLIGNLGTDPVYHQFSADNGVCKFRLCSNYSYKDANGNWSEGNNLFISVDCFGKLAENARRSLVKGMSVIVSGKLTSSEWKDAEGNSRSQIIVKAEHIGADLARYLTNSVCPGQTVKEAVPGETPAADTDRSWVDTSSYRPDEAASGEDSDTTPPF